MAEATAHLRGVRISARKARLVADLIRGQRVDSARDTLAFTVKKASPIVLKLLNSAVANAENEAAESGDRVDTDAYVVKRIFVNEGRTLRRFRPAARGRAVHIRKRSSHITIVVGDPEDNAES